MGEFGGNISNTIRLMAYSLHGAVTRGVTGNGTSITGNNGSWSLSLSRTSVNISTKHVRIHSSCSWPLSCSRSHSRAVWMYHYDWSNVITLHCLYAFLTLLHALLIQLLRNSWQCHDDSKSPRVFPGNVCNAMDRLPLAFASRKHASWCVEHQNNLQALWSSDISCTNFWKRNTSNMK